MYALTEACHCRRRPRGPPCATPARLVASRSRRSKRHGPKQSLSSISSPRGAAKTRRRSFCGLCVTGAFSAPKQHSNKGRVSASKSDALIRGGNVSAPRRFDCRRALVAAKVANSHLRRSRASDLFSLSVLAGKTALGRTGFPRWCASCRFYRATLGRLQTISDLTRPRRRTHL